MKAAKDDLLRWICERRATNSPLDRHLLREKAVELAKIHGLSESKCTDRWLTTFLRSHGFSTSLQGDEGPKFADYRDWIDLMRPTITRYRHRDLFHADELSMYTDVTPAGVSRRGKTAQEVSRNRITALMCCNSSGTTKLPLVICGSYPSRTTKYEHVYYPGDDPSVEERAFADWLSRVNDRMRRCDRRILLFLRRRASAVGDFELSNVSLVFLPEDFPTLLGPLRRDVFHYVKMIFRRRYAERLKRPSTSWSHQDVLEALIDAWERVPAEIVACSFQRTHFRTDDVFLQITCDSWSELKTEISFRRFVTFDDDLSQDQSCERSERSAKDRAHGYNLRASARSEAHGRRIPSHNSTSDRGEEAKGGKREVKDDNEDPSKEIAQSSIKDTPKNTEHFRIVQNESRNEDFSNEEEGVTGGIDEIQLQQGELGRSGAATVEKRFHYENELISGDQRGNACSSDDIDVGTWRSIESGQSKETRAQSEGIVKRKLRGSVQTIIDRALTMTSTTKTNYVRRLVDNIYASNEETRRHVNSRLMEPTCSTENVVESPRRSKAGQANFANKEESQAVNSLRPDKSDRAERFNCAAKEDTGETVGSAWPSKSAIERFAFANTEDESQEAQLYLSKGETGYCSLAKSGEEDGGNRSKCLSKDKTERPGCASSEDPDVDVTSANLFDGPFCNLELKLKSDSPRCASSSTERRRITAPSGKAQRTLSRNFTVCRSETISTDQTKSNSSPTADSNEDEGSRLPTQREDTKSFKRRRSKTINVNGSGDNSNDNEPAEKKSRTNSDWSRQYETTFVFGSPRASESPSKRAS